MTSVGNDGLSELERHSAPVFAAFGALHNARLFHADAMREVEECFFIPRQGATQAEIAWQLYKLPDLEAAEIASLASLHDAEKAVLIAHPSTLEGSIAFLSFLQSHLADDPDLGLVIRGIADVEAVLLSLA